MARRNVRVDIPIKRAEDMITLTEDILTQHNALGNNSPLQNLDMAGLQAQHDIHKVKRPEADTLHGQAEAANQAADKALGVAEQQSVDTEGTVYYIVTRVRDTLLITHEEDEEELNNYGFNVVIDKVRGRKTIKVDIPIGSPNDMILLTEKILAQHTALGNNSPLQNLDMAELQVQHDIHKTKRKEGSTKHGQGETATLAANNALGTGKQQNVQTKGTIYNIVTRVRDTLLITHQNMEEELNSYGFNVVISTTGPGNGQPQADITAVTDQSTPGQINIDMSGTAGEEVTIEWGDNNATPVTLQGNPASFPHTYTVADNYNIKIVGSVGAIEVIRLTNTKLTDLSFPDAMNPKSVEISDNHIATLLLHNTFTNLLFFFASNNDLDLQSVNNLLVIIDGFGTSNGQIFLNGGTNAAPTGAGLTAKAALQGRGWAVNTN